MTLTPEWPDKTQQLFSIDRLIYYHMDRLKHPVERIRAGARKSLAYYLRMKDIIIKVRAT